MSFAVQRGEATAAQRFLDARLSEAASESARSVTLSELIYHCMNSKPDNINMINGVTGVSLSNRQVLSRAVPLARALVSRRLSHRVMLAVMRNTESLVALYYAALFAGVKIFLLDPQSTQRELNHFLPIVEPSLIVCDAEKLEDVKAAVEAYGGLSVDAVLENHDLENNAREFDSDPAKFQPIEVSPESCAVMLPTSGSTGLPKVAELTHAALIVQSPSIWSDFTSFPRPTERLLFMSTAQWMTFTNFLTTCPVYEITLIITADKAIPNVLQIIETFKPTWLLQSPRSAVELSDLARADQLSSVTSIVITGAPPSAATLRRLTALVPQASVSNSYGMTEATGFVTSSKYPPIGSIGKVFNIFQYKLVDDNEEIVPRGTKGELYLTGQSLIKRYLKNEEAYQECATTDGWWRTGDIFTEDEDNNLYFVERKRFWFKYNNYHISPEEVESVINSVEGVLECVVAGVGRGAAAAVVRRPGSNVSREDIHSAVNSALIEHKRLRGGIAFVDHLPRTHSGKLHRADCARLIANLCNTGECL